MLIYSIVCLYNRDDDCTVEASKSRLLTVSVGVARVPSVAPNYDLGTGMRDKLTHLFTSNKNTT